MAIVLQGSLAPSMAKGKSMSMAIMLHGPLAPLMTKGTFNSVTVAASASDPINLAVSWQLGIFRPGLKLSIRA